MWSDKQIELSWELFKFNGVSVKSLDDGFGILHVTDNPRAYTVLFYDEAKTAAFSSVEELIDAGWVVD